MFAIKLFRIRENFEWNWMCFIKIVQKARPQNVLISRKILSEKANQFTHTFGENFTPTDWWLTRWKERNNIVSWRFQWGNIRLWFSSSWLFEKKSLKGFVKWLWAQLIFNADETGLYYIALPEHTLMFKGEVNYGSKKLKHEVQFSQFATWMVLNRKHAVIGIK